MKRTLILLLFCLILASCSGGDQAETELFTYPIDAVGILTFDGKPYSVELKMPTEDDVTLTLLGPENISGMYFKIKDGKTFIGVNGIEIELNDEGYAQSHGILICTRLFRKDHGELSSSSLIDLDGIKYCRSTYSLDGGGIVYYIQKGLNTPEKIEADLLGHTISFAFVNE